MPSICLAIRLGGQRKMIYVPHALEETVRRWFQTGQEVDGLLDAIPRNSAWKHSWPRKRRPGVRTQEGETAMMARFYLGSATKRREIAVTRVSKTLCGVIGTTRFSIFTI